MYLVNLERARDPMPLSFSELLSEKLVSVCAGENRPLCTRKSGERYQRSAVYHRMTNIRERI